MEEGRWRRKEEAGEGRGRMKEKEEKEEGGEGRGRMKEKEEKEEGGGGEAQETAGDDYTSHFLCTMSDRFQVVKKLV